VDFKGWFRTRDGQPRQPLTVRDLFSRFILASASCRWSTSRCAAIFKGFQHYGSPKSFAGSWGAFCRVGPLELSRLSAWWLRLASSRVHAPGLPAGQRRARTDASHLQGRYRHTPPRTPQAQQRRSTRWTDYYNQDRPHEGWPANAAQLYRKSRRRYRGPLPRCGIAPLRSRRSVACFIHWRGARGHWRASARRTSDSQPAKKGGHEVYFERHLIGLLVDTDPGECVQHVGPKPNAAPSNTVTYVSASTVTHVPAPCLLAAVRGPAPSQWKDCPRTR